MQATKTSKRETNYSSKMLKCMSKLVLVALFLMFVQPYCDAQTDMEQFLTAHATARSAVKVEPLVWDDTVADYAQQYAYSRQADCGMVHSGGTYGENLAGSSNDMSIADAVKMWDDEKVYYDYESNTCQTGMVCGHYTQVVWRKSERLGCAKVTCDNGGTFIICNYDPPGNWNGEKPYLMAY